MIRLIMGGEKSGKSDLAYRLLLAATGPRMILAMGYAKDEAFRRQILLHRLRRDPKIPLKEPGLELASAIAEARASGLNVLVDSLDFWLFACLEAGQDRTGELAESLACYGEASAPECVLVSCEVGLGPIGATPLVRRFARAQGALNQRLATLASDVRLVVAGLPISLK